MQADDTGARCSIEGCDRPATVVFAAGLLCGHHAARHLRCSVDGCDCWADVAVAGRLLCRHHVIEYRQTGHTRPAARRADSAGSGG